MITFGHFELIRIINLPSRLDRRREMARELCAVGLRDDPRVEFADGVLVDHAAPFRARGEKGVFLAHLNVLREAAQVGKSVLILEDDVDFTKQASSWQPAETADICYGGYMAANPADLVNSDIIGAHCMGFSARAAAALVPFLEELLHHDSPPPIDGAYVWFRRQTEGFTTLFANPVIAIQRPSKSDIAPRKLFDRVPILRDVVSIGRSMKRKLRRAELTFGLPEAVLISVVGITIAVLAAYHFTH